MVPKKILILLLLAGCGFMSISCGTSIPSQSNSDIPLIDRIISEKEISRDLQESITISDGYTASYFVPPNRLSTPCEIKLNSLGEIFVAEVRGGGISKVSPTGEVTFWASTADIGSYSIAFDSQNNLYSYNFPNGTIFKITPQQNVSTLFENNADLQCYFESYIAVNPITDELYIIRNSDVTGLATLYRVNNAGSLVTIKTGFSYISAMAFDNNGSLFWSVGYQIRQFDLDSLTETTIASLPGNLTISNHGLIIDDAGIFYAATATRLYKISASGSATFLVSGFSDLEGLAAAADGTIYGVDRATCGVYKISESALQAECLVPPSYISTPQALAFNSEGKLIVTEDETGTFGTYSSQGTFESFTSAVVYQPPLADLAIDSDDNIYISESAPGFSDRLMLYDKNGGSRVVSTELLKPSGLALYNDELYVAEFDGGRISKVGLDGSRTTYVDGLTHPEAIDFDQSGNLYVAAGTSALNEPAAYIEKISADKSITRFTTLEGITYIKFDASGSRLLVSTNSGKIYSVSPAGESSLFLSGLSSASGLAFDSAGNLYVSDDTQNAVYKLTPGQ